MPWYITDWAWNAMYRRFMRLIFRRGAEVAGECRRCGRCCREIVLQVEGKWVRSKRQFRRLQAKDSDLERFVVKGKDDDGRIIFGCTWLTEEGLCRDYENRLELCRNHPNASLYYSGVVLARYCGYTLKGPGLGDFVKWIVPAKTRPSFEEVLDRERTGTQQGTEKSDS